MIARPIPTVRAVPISEGASREAARMLRDGPRSIPPEIWAKIPPAPRAAIAILTARGHVVTVRINRNGSARYSVDGKKDVDAATMVRRYKVDNPENALTIHTKAGWQINFRKE